MPSTIYRLLHVIIELLSSILVDVWPRPLWTLGHLSIAWIKVFKDYQWFSRTVIGNTHPICSGMGGHKKFVLSHLVEAN